MNFSDIPRQIEELGLPSPTDTDLLLGDEDLLLIILVCQFEKWLVTEEWLHSTKRSDVPVQTGRPRGRPRHDCPDVTLEWYTID